MKIALVKGFALGDVVRTTALAGALVRDFPQAQLTWFTADGAIALLAGNPNIHATTSITDPAESHADAVYDWVICLDEEAVSVRRATALRAEKRSGVFFDSSGEPRFTDDLRDWFGMGLLAVRDGVSLDEANRRKKSNRRSHLTLVHEGLGLDPALVRPTLFLTDDERMAARDEFARRSLLDARPRVGIFLGGSKRWERRSWEPLQRERLIRALAERVDATLVCIGELTDLAGSTTDEDGDSLRTPRLVPETPRSLAATIGQLDLLVSTDSLPLHLAVAQGVPVVGLFGPTSAAEIDLFGAGEKIETSLTCRGCLLSRCSLVEDCRDGFTVESVLSAMNRSAGIKAKVPPYR